MSNFKRVLVIMPLLLIARETCAQSGIWWVVPPSTVKVDFSAQNKQRKAAFDDQGMALEVSGRFPFVGQDRIVLDVNLPESGKFDVRIDSAPDFAEVQDVRRDGARGSCQIARKVMPISEKQFRESAEKKVDDLLEPGRQAGLKDAEKKNKQQLRSYLRSRGEEDDFDKDDKLRQAYARAWAVENKSQPVLKQMESLCETHTLWHPAKDRQAWSSLDGKQIVEMATAMLVCHAMDVYLHKLGMEFDGNKPVYQKLIPPKAEGVYLILSGLGAKKERAGDVGKLLNGPEIQKLQQLFTVQAHCLLYPEMDPRDPDSLWFNGQRVACRGVGIGSITVQGELDPAKGDSIDWWLLERDDPQTVELSLPKQAGVQADPLYSDERGTRLRILAAGDQAVTYSFEIRLQDQTKAGVRKVEVFETPGVAKAAFPF